MFIAHAGIDSSVHLINLTKHIEHSNIKSSKHQSKIDFGHWLEDFMLIIT